MLWRCSIVCSVLALSNAHPGAAQKNAPGARAATEVLTCRNGTEDRHARIAVVLVDGKADSFAYYSKWKPRTCSIYLQRKQDPQSRWRDSGPLTTVNVEHGQFLIEHRKGEYRFVFRDIDRQRYCGMDGLINGTLTIRKGSDLCELAGIMEEGVPLGQAYAHLYGNSGAPVSTAAAAPSAVAAASANNAPRATAAAGSTAGESGRGSTAPWYRGWWRGAQSTETKSAWPASAD